MDSIMPFCTLGLQKETTCTQHISGFFYLIALFSSIIMEFILNFVIKEYKYIWYNIMTVIQNIEKSCLIKPNSKASFYLLLVFFLQVFFCV